MSARTREWIKRYLPAEVLSLVLTILSALLAYHFTHSRLFTALTGTWVGNIGYFGYILYKDVADTRKHFVVQQKAFTLKTFGKNILVLAVEFGPAELMDSFFIRPALMFYLPVLLGNLALGIILAKFAADITFYIPAIMSYELSKKKFRKYD